MQSKEDIEKAAEEPDHWRYQSIPDDAMRKAIILRFCGPIRYKRALDIGAYEGWITQDLPADEIEGYEISDNASARFPANVKRTLEPSGEYDLIIATGVMYGHYDWQKFLDIIEKHAVGNIVLCNIKEWIVPQVKERLGEPDIRFSFLYRGEFTELVQVWTKRPSFVTPSLP